MESQTTRFETSIGQEDWIDKLFRIIDIAFCSFVCIYSGAIVGWLFGLCVGNFYVKHWQPVYASAYFSLTEISEWELKPSLIADKGARIGAVVGAIIISVIWIGLRRKRSITKPLGSVREKNL